MKTSYTLSRPAYNAKLELRAAEWVEPNGILGVPYAGREARVTYWLVYGSRIVGSVRGKMGLSDDSVRSVALMDLQRNPTIYADHPDVCPYEHRIRISQSDVVTYYGGN